MASRYYENPKFTSIVYFTIDVGPGSYRAGSDFGIYESKLKEKFLAQENEKLASISPKSKKE